MSLYLHVLTYDTCHARKPGVGGYGGMGGGGTYFVSMGKDVPSKGVQFSESVWDRLYSIVQILGMGSNIPVWTVWKGVPACLERTVKLPLPRIEVP